MTKTKLKKHDDNNVKHLASFDTENKYLNPNWMLGHHILTLYLVRWIGLVLMTPKTYDNHILCSD